MSNHIPDGEYDARITDITQSDLPAGGQLVELDLDVEIAPGHWVSTSKRYHVNSPKAAEFLKRELVVMGLKDIAHRDDLAKSHGRLIGLRTRIAVRTVDGFQQIYVARLHSEDAVVSGPCPEIGW